jgi:ribosomal protein S18 acetylase RimI-like enzyme
MDWAMQTFRLKNVHSIEVKVAAGNDAIHLYEKYGFRINAQILRLDI